MTGSEDEAEIGKKKSGGWGAKCMRAALPQHPHPVRGGDVQRQPVIGGVNWQIQYESRACSLSSSTGEAGSLN